MKQISNFKKLGMFVLGIILSLNTVAQSWPPAGINGDGLTDSTAWEITTPAELAALSNYTNNMGRYFKLMNDIDLSGYSAGAGWLPIGSSTTSFQGHFNGNGYVVRNLTINRPSQDNIGLFGYATSNATIKNLGVENCNIIGQYQVGGLVGTMTHCIISNCYVTGSVNGTTVGGLVGKNHYSNITNCYTTVNVSAENFGGGLVGSNSFTVITDCYSTGNVNGRQNVGGLVGYNSGEYNSYVSIITNCYATGNVSAQAENMSPSLQVGGLVGNNNDSAIIRNCYATGDVNVTGTSKFIGGLVGENRNNATIINSYAIGNVTGEEAIGGLSGSNSTGCTIDNCYAVGKVSGTEYVGGLVGFCYSSTTRNCVAANDSIKITSTSVNINRITGFGSGTLQNNYANTNMVVMQNGTQVTPTDGMPASGTGKSMGTLESLSFYTTDSLWYLAIWDFTYAWNICDGERLPFLRWQDIDCGAVIPVTNIIGVPTNAMINDSVGLTVTVLPYNATNTSIVWSVNNSDTTGASIIDGNIFSATTAGTAIITATIIDGIAPGTPYTQDFNIIVNNAFVPVTNITGVPSTATATVPLTLTGTVEPGNATNQTIVWSVNNSGTTGASITGGNTFNAITPGTAIITATIVDGIAPGTPYTQNFNIIVYNTFVPVTNITGVPSTATATVPLTLTGTVEPGNATNQTIVWSVNNSGTTDASITGSNIFNATTAGPAIITATIVNGTAPGTPYTKNFNIIVGTDGVVEIATREISVFPNPTSHELRIKSGELKIEKVKIYDMLGRNLLSQSSFQSQEISIDISQLPRGIYFVKMETELGEVVKKVIKE